MVEACERDSIYFKLPYKTDVCELYTPIQNEEKISAAVY